MLRLPHYSKNTLKLTFAFMFFSEKGGRVFSLNVFAAKVTNFRKKDFSFCLIQTFHSFDLILNGLARALRTALPKKSHKPPSFFVPPCRVVDLGMEFCKGNRGNDISPGLMLLISDLFLFLFMSIIWLMLKKGKKNKN